MYSQYNGTCVFHMCATSYFNHNTFQNSNIVHFTA